MADPYELPTELNIYSAMETHTALAAWLAGQIADPAQPPLRVSARQVQEVDGAGLQLIAALANSGHPWQLVHASNAFKDACEVLGLSAWLAHVQPFEGANA